MTFESTIITVIQKVYALDLRSEELYYSLNACSHQHRCRIARVKFHEMVVADMNNKFSSVAFTVRLLLELVCKWSIRCGDLVFSCRSTC